MKALTERFEMRLTPENVEALDEWRRDERDLPSRGEAIRRLVARGYLYAELRDIAGVAIGLLNDETLNQKLTDEQKKLVGSLTEIFAKLDAHSPGALPLLSEPSERR